MFQMSFFEKISRFLSLNLEEYEFQNFLSEFLNTLVTFAIER